MTTSTSPEEKQLLKLRGYRADNFTYNSRTGRYAEVHLFDLEVEQIPTLPIDEKKDYYWFVSGSVGQPIKLNKDQIYPTEFVYLPTHLVQQRSVDVDELELEILAKESKRAGFIWCGKIRGAAEISELLSAAQIPSVGVHMTIEDNKKNLPEFYPLHATIDPNDPDRWEEFYKPATFGKPIYAGGHCKKANCPLCRPLEYFEAQRKAGKITQSDIDDFLDKQKIARGLLGAEEEKK